MNRRQHELVLKKQRLQFRSSEQRRQLEQHAIALFPVFAGAEHIRNGVRWIREHSAVMTAVVVAIIVARPRTVLRWARRGWLAWLAWRQWKNPDHSKSSFQGQLKGQVKRYAIGRILGLFLK